MGAGCGPYCRPISGTTLAADRTVRFLCWLEGASTSRVLNLRHIARLNAADPEHGQRPLFLSPVINTGDIPPDLLARLVPRLDRSRLKLGDDLSAREREVLGLLAAGASTKAIAGELHLSVNTVRNHVQQVLVKLGAHSKLEAVSIAVREGIVRIIGP